LLLALDEIASKVVIEDGEAYESVSSQLAMAVTSNTQNSLFAKIICFDIDIDGYTLC